HIPCQEEVDQRDLAVVQVGQVDARVEDAPPSVLGVLDDLAAQYANFDPRVEQDQVGADLQTRHDRVILGVEKARVTVQQIADIAAPLDGDGADLDSASAPELRQQRLGFRPRT